MTYQKERESLSQTDRLKRTYYDLLRDDLDQFIIDYALIESYHNFRLKAEEYPFVEKRELKPRALLPDMEYENQNSCLVIFLEDTILDIHKKYIHFFDVNRTTKTNLLRSKSLPFDQELDRYQKYLESAHFFNFLRDLLPVDYALLIQRDQTAVRNRYSLSHYHVRIDWPIADATEDMARNLRYISKELYEKGDKWAEDLQKKFFEYHALPMMVGGRRTAAIVAAQYLSRLDFISTVYVGSSETRCLIRLSEKGVAKFILMKFSEGEVRRIVEDHNLNIRIFNKNYVVIKEGKDCICIFKTSYALTEQALPPIDGKLRHEIKDINWLRVATQSILPKPGIRDFAPLPQNLIYS